MRSYSIFIEGLFILKDMEKGKKYNIEDLMFSCIYILYKKGIVVYVGQTTQGYRRIYQHIKDKDFDNFEILKCEQSNLDEEESNLIIKYSPKYNGTLGNYRSLENIKKYLSIISIYVYQRLS